MKAKAEVPEETFYDYVYLTIPQMLSEEGSANADSFKWGTNERLQYGQDDIKQAASSNVLL